MPEVSRQQKITFEEMRASGVRGVLVYCSDYRCSHSIAICPRAACGARSSCPFPQLFFPLQLSLSPMRVFAIEVVLRRLGYCGSGQKAPSGKLAKADE
jgi:hypothetical protein